MFKKLLKTRFNVSTDYLIVFITISLGIIVMSAVMCIATYNNKLSSQHDKLKQETFKAESIISEAINEHSWQIRSIADKIMKSDGSPETINKIISNHNKFDPNSNFNQFLDQKDLFWVDKDDNLIIKNKVGILQYPHKVSKLYEVFNAKEDPWKLVISKDLPSFQKGYNLILTSFGVTDSNGNYMGSIISSIDISLIQNLLIKNLNSQDTNNIQVLSSYNNRIVFQSDQKNILTTPDIFTHKLGNIDYTINQDGYIDEEIPENKVKYSYYKKITSYPFVILSGYNYQLYRSDLYKSLLKAIYPSITIGLILIICLFVFYRRIIKPVNYLAGIAKKISSKDEIPDIKFPKINSPEIFLLAKALVKINSQKKKLRKSNFELRSAKNRLEKTIDIEVIKKSDSVQNEIIRQIKEDISKNTAQVFQILNMLKYNFDNKISDKQINLFLIQSVEQGINNITKFATDELNKELSDIKHIVSKALLSQEKEIKIRGIKLEVFYDNKLPKKIFVDQVRLIQILSSILHKTFVLLSKDNSVKISVKTTIRNKKKNLLIQIDDDGIGIGFKDYNKSAKKIGNKEEIVISGINISEETIENLITLHHGEIFYNDKIQQGSTVKILIPYGKEVKKIPSEDFTKKADNIIYLPIKK